MIQPVRSDKDLVTRLLDSTHKFRNSSHRLLSNTSSDILMFGGGEGANGYQVSDLVMRRWRAKRVRTAR